MRISDCSSDVCSSDLAQDAAHLDRADGLKFALRQAAKLFADQFNYHDEARDTWELMIGSRMVEWHPRVEPTADAWERAEDQLHQAGAHYRSSRERAGPPGLHARTRSERRWRRRLWRSEEHTSELPSLMRNSYAD